MGRAEVREEAAEEEQTQLQSVMRFRQTQRFIRYQKMFLFNQNKFVFNKIFKLLLRSHQIFSSMLKLFLSILDVTTCAYLKTCIVSNHIC